jgi:hypothetical protein
VLHVLGRHHTEKLTYDLNTNAPRLPVLALHKHELPILSQTNIDTAVRPVFDVVQHQKALAPERLADSGKVFFLGSFLGSFLGDRFPFTLLLKKWGTVEGLRSGYAVASSLRRKPLKCEWGMWPSC